MSPVLIRLQSSFRNRLCLLRIQSWIGLLSYTFAALNLLATRYVSLFLVRERPEPPCRATPHHRRDSGAVQQLSTVEREAAIKAYPVTPDVFC